MSDHRASRVPPNAYDQFKKWLASITISLAGHGNSHTGRGIRPITIEEAVDRWLAHNPRHKAQRNAILARARRKSYNVDAERWAQDKP